MAEHPQLAPGEASVLDEHYPTPRKPAWRGPRARTETEKEFLALGAMAAAFFDNPKSERAKQFLSKILTH